MSAASQAGQHSDAGRIHPVEFVANVFVKYILVLAVLPLLFVVAKPLGIAMFPSTLSQRIVDAVAPIWPVFSEQYNAILSTAGTKDGANYVLFAMILLLSFLAAFIHSVVAYRRSSIRFKEFALRDVVLIGVGTVLAYAALKLDDVLDHPTPIFDFYVDRAGLYYFRQFVVYSAAYSTASIALFIVVGLLSNKRPTKDERLSQL